MLDHTDGIFYQYKKIIISFYNYVESLKVIIYKRYVIFISWYIEDYRWLLYVISQDVKTLLISLSYVVFYWVRRDANSVVHVLAKFTSCNSCFFYCNFESLPSLVKEA